MCFNNMLHKRISPRAIPLVLLGFVAGVHANNINVLTLNTSQAGASRVLRFPADQCLGSIYLAPELGIQWDSKHVCIDDNDWDRMGIAQNEVIVPAGRPSQLIVMMTLEPQQAARLRVQNPRSYSNLVSDRPRVDPYDLSGLSTLGPNDLDVLTVNAHPGNTDADRCVLEKILHLKGLSVLRLHGTGITDKGMEQLRSISSLQGLELSQEKSVKNQGLAVLKDLPELRYLDLDSGLTDAGLRQIGAISSLQWLSIGTGKIWGPGLAELAHLPRLERLCLQGESQLSDRHIQYLEGLENIRSLTLWGGCDRLTNRSLVSISRLTSLEELYFIRTSPKFTPTGIVSLKTLKHLRIVDFGQAMVGDEGVHQLATAVPQLESIEGGLRVTAKGMKSLGTLQNLKCLRVGLMEPLQGYYGPTGTSHLAHLGSLEELALQARDQSDADLLFLEQLTSLKRLSVGGKGITDRGLKSIARLSQLESLGLAQTSVTKQGLNQLAELENLQGLNVKIDSDMWGVHDESTLRLSGLRNLKRLRLSGLSLHEEDLAFLSHVKDLEALTIETPFLSDDALQPIKHLGRLKLLYVKGLSCTKDSGLLPLNGLSGLHDVTLSGKISDAALGSLADLENIWGLTIQTSEPIQRQTRDNLSKRLPGIEFLHIYELPKVPTQSVQRPERTNDSRPRNNLREPVHRRRKRR
jgi:hypothetical protein